MNNERTYLIPANIKKSQLIFSMFTWFDLILFGIGAAVSVIWLMTASIDTLAQAIVILLPIGITFFLVLPVAHYHNVLHVIISIVTFYTSDQKLKWRGWCMYDKIKSSKEKSEYKIY